MEDNFMFHLINEIFEKHEKMLDNEFYYDGENSIGKYCIIRKEYIVELPKDYLFYVRYINDFQFRVLFNYDPFKLELVVCIYK